MRRQDPSLHPPPCPVSIKATALEQMKRRPTKRAKKQRVPIPVPIRKPPKRTRPPQVDRSPWKKRQSNKRRCHTPVTRHEHNALSQRDLAHLQRARLDAGLFRFCDMLFTKFSQSKAQIEHTKGFDPVKKPAHAGFFVCVVFVGHLRSIRRQTG